MSFTTPFDACRTFHMNFQPLIRVFCNKEHAGDTDSSSITDLICRFFENIHQMALTHDAKDATITNLETFTAQILRSDSKVQLQFSKTYILEDPSTMGLLTQWGFGSDVFANAGPRHLLQKVLGFTQATTDAPLFDFPFFEQMGVFLLKDLRTQDFFESCIRRLPKNDDETVSEHMARATKSGLELLFPATKEGGVFPTTLDVIAERIPPVATVGDVQIVLDKLTDHLHIDALDLPAGMSPENADRHLAAFINDNKEALANFKSLMILNATIRMLPVAVKLLELEELSVIRCPFFKIPLWMDDLQSLKKINFAGCRIAWFPPSLENLQNLGILNLSNNQIAGAIPASLGNLQNLVELYLRNNQITGTIPASLGNLGKLIVLNLSINQLTGAIPSSLGNLQNLVELYLRNNQITGTIPASLGNLGKLIVLNLSINQLTGAIPSSLVGIVNL